MDVARRIRDLLSDRDIKIRTLAIKLGIKEGTLGGYIRAERTMPYEVMVQIADILNVSTDYLLERTDIAEIPLRLTESEQLLIQDLRQLTREQKEIAANSIRFMRSQNQR